MYSAMMTLRYWTVSGETEIVKGLREEVGRGGGKGSSHGLCILL